MLTRPYTFISSQITYPILLPSGHLLTLPYTFLPGQTTLPDSSPNRTSTYPAIHSLTRPNYLTRSFSPSEFCLPNHTQPPYLTSLPGWVTLRCARLLTRPYPITLPGRVPFNWPHLKTSSWASHLDLGLHLTKNASRQIGCPKPTRVTLKQPD
jgi:hypothetical protein